MRSQPRPVGGGRRDLERARRLIAVLFLAILGLLAAPASAQTFPPFSGYVVDAAGILPPADEAALTGKLQALQKDTGRQLAIATVPSLQGHAIEDYGYRLGRAWGVGAARLNNGAILLVAPNERKVRVEVGYGLTPVLTDALSGLIIRQRILPAFRAGDMAGGIAAGADAIIAQLRLPDPDARAKVAEAASAREADLQGGDTPVTLIFWVILFLFVLLPMLRRRGRGRRYRRGGMPVILWGPGFGGGGGWGGGGSSGGGFSGGGGGSFGGGGASGSW